MALPCGAGAQTSTDRIVATYRGYIEEKMAHGQLDESYFDTKKVLDEIAYRTQRGVSQELTWAWLQEQMLTGLLSFATPGARHSGRTRYRLPFDPAEPRLVSQAFGGPSHQNQDYFACDFVMPTGTPVLAIRGGSVARVADGYTEGGMLDRLKGKDNAVFVLHSDGSFAVYGHLSPGIPVKEGQKVEAGDRLASSGDTGWANGPHLHFAVYVLESPGLMRSVHITFSDAEGNDFVPKANVWYPEKPSAVGRE